MTYLKKIMKSGTEIIMLTVVYVQICSGVHWDKIHCQLDLQDNIQEGLVPKEHMGWYPWMGVIQHDFFIANKMRHAITAAVLIHPAYALAPAEDMAKINRQTISNTTRFILWFSETTKHMMKVEDYVMHHEYELEKTYATIALVEISPDGATTSGHPAVIFPICLPIKGIGTFEKLYVVRMTDTTGELRKEVTKVDYVDTEDCNVFYEKAELNYELMVPSNSICATSHAQQPACVWDGGAVLVSKRAESWILLGFGTHGPGCGAPARFVDVNSHMEWIDIQITAIGAQQAGDDTGYMLRSNSPVEIIMYKPGELPTTEEGQCSTSRTTGVIYRDSTDVSITNNYGRGYFFPKDLHCWTYAYPKEYHKVRSRPPTSSGLPRSSSKMALSDQADFSCLIVNLHSNMRSNAAMWVEHECHRDMSGTHGGQDKRRLQCYKYFRTTAFIEFRFTFSYTASLEVKVFGQRAVEPSPPLDPWAGPMTTLTWWPTDGERRGLRWGLFVPVDAWWYWM